MWFGENGVCSYLHSFPGTCHASRHVSVSSLVLFPQGIGLQMGSDLYLLFDPREFHYLQQVANNLTGTVKMMGSFIADNDTQTVLPLSTTFVFTNAIPSTASYIVLGCFRPPNDPWYLRSAPFWAQFFIVPVFSMLSSLANLQPISDWKSRQNLLVMVVISCVSFATNKVANHYIFNHSNVVSAIGAFTIGILGNIRARSSGGSAFTSMVTGVLFLVPVSYPSCFYCILGINIYRFTH
jgi:hypothetical protein